MTRLGWVFWVVLVLAAGFATFKVKYAVQNIEDQLDRARRQTIAEQQEIRVLTAEWTYLNQPERLADLNQRFLGLQPIAARQLQQSIDAIPLRPPPVPAPPPPVEAVVATTSPASPTPAPASPPVATASPREPAAETAAPPRMQLAKAAVIAAPRSLDALFAQISDKR